MKRTFLKVLPFAAALLLATSCSKDDNNSTDEIVNNGGEQIETVTKTFKTLTVKGKVNKSISKVTTNQDETALAFEGNEQFTFGSESADVYGTINFTNADGTYEATINYANEQALSGNFTASLGSNPELMSDAYENLTAAVQKAYYTIDFTIIQVDGEYKLRSGETDIVVNLQSAFIKALSAETTKLGDDEITVVANKYYVVPVGKTMGETQNTTIAGKIYSLGGVKVTSITVTGGFSSSSSNPYVWGSETTDNKTLTATIEPSNATNKNVKWSSNASNVTVDENTGKITITAPNTGTSIQTITITATAQDGSAVTGTYTLYLANYVQLADAKWYTYDSQTSVTWANCNNDAPEGSAVPSHIQFAQLGSNIINGTQIKSDNGSNAYITLNYGDYWASSGFNNSAYYLLFDSHPSVKYKSKDSNCRVRLVRAQQNFTTIL